MNVSELARRLRVHPKMMLDILPRHGFDIGAKAVKIDDRVAETIIRRWKHIQKSEEDRRRKGEELEKQKQKQARREAGHSVTLPKIITVKEFAERLKLPITQIIMELMKNGILASQNQNIDFETATIMAEELGFSVAKEAGNKAEEEKEENRASHLETALNKGARKSPRAPVVVVMGHVDHGKTTLLDVIREANITATESGGITQHIGAYQTLWRDPKTKAERALTFIDTPGHEAFTVMRSRGAKVADLAILVVAADDGVKPQTEEVIQIIKAAKLPFVVAINKIDKDGADVMRVKTELSNKGVLPEDWGGDVPMVEISAKKNLNIDKLLDLLLLVADLRAEEIVADENIPPVGTIIDSRVDKGMGPVVTLLIQAGTLKKGDPVVIGRELYGKVRSMKDFRGRELEEAGPSVPVQIIGLKVAAEMGDILDLSDADNAEAVDVRQKRSSQTGAERVLGGEMSVDSGEEGQKKKILNVVVKADVLGSLEAIIGAFERFRHDEVAVKIIGKGLGNIMDNDVSKAASAGAVILAFHVNVTPRTESEMRDKQVEHLRFDVIYDLLDWVKNRLESMLPKEMIVTELGILKVLGIFRTEKNSMTIGGRVEDGKAVKGCLARVKRNGEIIGVGKIASLQRGKQDVKEAPGGVECGMRFEGKIKVEIDDVLELYSEESKIRKIVFE